MGMVGIAGVVVDPVKDYTRKVTMLAAKTQRLTYVLYGFSIFKTQGRR
jgi:hypothetical protein